MNELLIPSLKDPPLQRPPAPLGEDMEAAPAIVYALRGEWLADCPNCKCPNLTGRGLRNDPPGLNRQRQYWCLQCANADIGFKVRRVEWPKEIQRIAEILRPRPEKNRNWLPGETIDNLIAENIEHGIEVPA